MTVGAGLPPVVEARKPKLVEAPAAKAPFQLTFRAVTVGPFGVTVAFHACEIC